MWGGVSGTWGVVGGLTWGARFINAKGVARRAEASASSRRNPPPHRPTRARSAGATIPTATQEPPCPLYSEQQRVLLLLLLHLRPFSLNRRNNLLALSALAILLQQIAFNLEWQKGRMVRGNGTSGCALTLVALVAALRLPPFAAAGARSVVGGAFFELALPSAHASSLLITKCSKLNEPGAA